MDRMGITLSRKYQSPFGTIINKIKKGDAKK